MAKLHHLGFPRIGNKRQLKFALESFWSGALSQDELQHTASQLRLDNWQSQQTLGLDFHTVGDFSFYDQVLDCSLLLGNLPKRALQSDNQLDNYFRVARGRSQKPSCCAGIHAHNGETDAGEMTKWFNTNYHYIVPEFDKQTTFNLNSDNLFKQIKELQGINKNVKPVIIGPVTYLWLGKEKDNSNKLALLPALLDTYQQLLQKLVENGIEWLQIDEPILALEIDNNWRDALTHAYQVLGQLEIKLLLTSYFGELKNNLTLACQLPVAGLHIDAVNALHEVEQVVSQLGNNKVLSLGIINGCNIWKTDLNATLQWLTPIHNLLKDRLWLAPNSSLLHVPVDLDNEQKLDNEIKNWLAFATQKLDELSLIGGALNDNIESVFEQLTENKLAIESRKNSARIHNPAVQRSVKNISTDLGKRKQPFALRKTVQKTHLNLPELPNNYHWLFPANE